MWWSVLASLLLLFFPLRAVANSDYNCSQFYTMPDGSPSAEDISSYLASKKCKADTSLMTLFNSQIGRNMFDALAMAKPSVVSIDSCDAFVALFTFTAMNSGWLDELCASGPLSSPGDGGERDYCRDASTYSGQLAAAIQTLETNAALRGFTNLSKIMKSFTDDSSSCQMACGSFIEGALCDGFVNLVTFISSKLRNGATITNIPAIDTSAFDSLSLDQFSESGSPAQRMFMLWWFLSNGYRPSQDSAQVDIQTEYGRFAAWKKQQEQQVKVQQQTIVQHVNGKREAVGRSGAARRRRSSGPSKS